LAPAPVGRVIALLLLLLLLQRERESSAIDFSCGSEGHSIAVTKRIDTLGSESAMTEAMSFSKSGSCSFDSSASSPV